MVVVVGERLRGGMWVEFGGVGIWFMKGDIEDGVEKR
jgi:hypothetical protein